MKAGYAKSMGLRGLFYWTGSGDAQEGSLVEAGAKGLREL
jgi:GH18 family chitinase